MIRLENLTKEYDVLGAAGARGPIVAADHLNLEVAKGEIFGLVGPNGAGKTTTLKMVCGLLMPTSGRVTVNGVDVERQPEEAQRHIGYLADFFGVYDDLNVWEYLDFFGNAYKLSPDSVPARIEYVLTRLGLETKRDSFISGLSRGMKQRLGIARSILHDPPVLVLDEPAAGLDPKARLQLKELLRGMNREGKTVFITSHVLSDLEEICTSLAILEKGRLLRVGKLDQVMRGETLGRRIRIRLAGDAGAFPLAQALAARTDVSNVALGSSAMPAEAAGAAPPLPSGVDAVGYVVDSATFHFTGDNTALADLVRELVTAGVPVCGVEEMTESLEQVFSRLSSGEVM